MVRDEGKLGFALVLGFAHEIVPLTNYWEFIPPCFALKDKVLTGLSYNQAIHLGFNGLTASSTCAGSVVQLPL